MKKLDVVAIDFDGVIVEYDGWQGHEHIGDMKDGENFDPINDLGRLKNNGYDVMIYTCRKKHEPVKDFLNDKGVPWDYINNNPHQPEGVAPTKVFADYYIDDRQPGFPGLTPCVDMILGKKGYNLTAYKGENLKEADRCVKKARREIYKANKSTRVLNKAIRYLKMAEMELPYTRRLERDHTKKCQRLDEKFGVNGGVDE